MRRISERESLAVVCPRCGYDLHGIVDSWVDTCPLVGECTECGLSYCWCEILNPLLRRPTWSVEYTRHWAHLPWRSLKTWGMLHWPWAFWRLLRMSHPPQWGRVAVMMLGVGVVTWMLVSISAGILEFRTANRNPWREVMLSTLFPLRNGAGTPFVTLQKAWEPWLSLVLYVLIFHAACAATFALLPQSRKLAKVRGVHIVRIAMYGLVPPLSMLALWGLANSLAPLLPFVALYTLFCVGHAVTWWGVATDEYLRMDHPYGVGGAATLIASLVIVIIAATIINLGSRSFLFDYLT